jgi:hypothetical protein
MRRPILLGTLQMRVCGVVVGVPAEQVFLLEGRNRTDFQNSGLKKL